MIGVSAMLLGIGMHAELHGPDCTVVARTRDDAIVLGRGALAEGCTLYLSPRRARRMAEVGCTCLYRWAPYTASRLDAGMRSPSTSASGRGSAWNASSPPRAVAGPPTSR